MIRIRKPVEPPAILAERGAATREADCELVAEGRAAELSFDAKIYGAAEVKDALIAAQHGKCCFCESKIRHISYGDVEHFRPKKAVCQSPELPLERPGYYWLAYDWTNMVLSCQLCNQRHKRNLFPLHDPATRARSETADIAAEQPLFIDPARVEPAAHITFRRELVAPVNRSPFAVATISNLALNRTKLVERRGERRARILVALVFVRMWIASGSVESNRRLVEKALASVLDALADEAEYAAMSRTIVRDALHWREVSSETEPAVLLSALEDDAEQGQWLRVPAR